LKKTVDICFQIVYNGIINWKKERKMFRIPEFYEMEMSFEDAARTISNKAKGDLLEGMKWMDQLWSDYVSLPGDEQDDDMFYDNWCYELNAYNVVYEGMSKLFAPKEAA
jgi:hypothetical protein